MTRTDEEQANDTSAVFPLFIVNQQLHRLFIVILILAVVGALALVGCLLVAIFFVARGVVSVLRHGGVAVASPEMDDNNLAIILALVLILLVILFAAFQARMWIKSFTQAMHQAREAERGDDTTTA